MIALTPDFLFPIFAFAFSTSITPGPNNMMLAASGAQFGFLRSCRHMLGVAVGFPVMVFGFGFGLSSVFARFPQIHQVLKVLGILYLVWIAWQIGTSKGSHSDVGSNSPSKPLTFFQAAAFQWVNPKAWMMASGAIAMFTTVDGALVTEVSLVAIIFLLVSLPCVALWTVAGLAIGRALSGSRWNRWFNVVMALLLLSSLVMFIDGLWK